MTWSQSNASVCYNSVSICVFWLFYQPAGDTEEERAAVDMVCDQTMDFHIPAAMLMYGADFVSVNLWPAEFIIDRVPEW